MTGSAFLVVLVLVLVLLLIVLGVASPIFVIPVVVIGLGLLGLPLQLGLLRRSSVAQPDPGPTGVPETSAAAHDPVREPRS
jgi:hypothetical protein